MGLVDRRAHRGRARGADAADDQAVQVHAEHGPVPAGDQEAPGEVQGRPGAAQPGDDEVLPGEQGEPVRLVPPARRAAPGLPLAVLHAAQGPAHRRLPGRQSARHREPRALRHRRRGAVPLHPGHHRQGDGRRPRRADRPLRRVAAAVDDPDVHRDGQDAADPLPRRCRSSSSSSSSTSRPVSSSTGSPRTSGRSCSRPSCGSGSGRCDQRGPTAKPRRCRSWTGCSTGDRRRPPAPRRPTAPAVANGKSGTAKASESKSGNGKTATAAPKPKSRPAAPPPPSPRKKKKRSGRRR